MSCRAFSAWVRVLLASFMRMSSGSNRSRSRILGDKVEKKKARELEVLEYMRGHSAPIPKKHVPSLTPI